MEQKRKIFDWIDKILKKNDYGTVDVIEEIEHDIKDLADRAECSWALYKSSGRCIQYVLVMDVGKADLKKIDLGNGQRNLYRNLQELGEKLEPEFDKNVSLLLCAEGNIADEGLEKEVLRIEENPYCFKKLALIYTQEEIESFEENIQPEEIWDFIKQKLEMLKEGKTEFDQETEFILKLLIKMPFLSVDVVKEYKKRNLMEEIEKSLDNRERTVWKDIKEMELTEIDEIKNHSEEQVDNILKKWNAKEEKGE